MAEAGAGALDRVLPATGLKALVAELRGFPLAIRDRGQRYARTGRVGSLVFDADTVRAPVRGTDSYDVTWEWDGTGVCFPSCTCPVAPYCKHAYALGCCILTHAQTHGGIAYTRLARLLPTGSRRQAAVSIPHTSEPADRVKERAASVGSAALSRLRAANQSWTRHNALDQLFARSPTRNLSSYIPPFPDLLAEPDPDLLCWRLAQEIPLCAGGWLPPALAPYRDRHDLAARHSERARAVLVGELAAWARRKTAATSRSLRLVLSLGRRPGGEVAVTIEARVTSPRLADEPRSMTQLGQLRSEAHRNPGVLAPDQAALLDWLVDHNVGGRDTYYGGFIGVLPGTLARLLERITDTPLASWAPDLAPDLAARGGVAAGSPVRLGSEVVHLLPVCVSHDDEVWIELRYLWPDGRQRRIDEVLYLRGSTEWTHSGRKSLVLSDGYFSVIGEEPPDSILEHFETAGGVPLSADTRTEALGLLAASFPHLHEALAAHTRFHPVTPVVTLDLRNDDWLQIRVFAHTGTAAWQPSRAAADGAIVFEYTPEGRWVRSTPASESGPTDVAPIVDDGVTGVLDSPRAVEPAGELLPAQPEAASAAEAAIWLEVPDQRAVDPVVRWLEGTSAGPGTKKGPGGHEPTAHDRNVGWWMQASRRRIEGLADAWDARPSGVAWFGSERVRRLLTRAERVVPRLRVESSGLDWFAVSAEWEAEGLRLSDADLARLRAATTRFVKLDAGWVRRDVAAALDETSDVLADLGVEIGAGTQRLSMWQLAGAKPETLHALERHGADAEAVRAARDLRARVERFAGLPSIPSPPGFAGALRPYQQHGVDFLAYTASLGVGAVLADDMGLGKTVQALAWLAHLRQQEPDGGPSLVVCPASVVHNWAREAERFAPSLRVLLVTSGEARHARWAAVHEHDLVVTNYALLRRDIERWREIELRVAILDEAQNVKNPDAAVTRAALTLSARHRLALTGTPLENRALDLWSIVSFVNPGYLGTRASFSARFDRLDAPPHVRTLLAAKLRPMLLRRTKRAVAPDLPPRIEERRDCELTKGQRQLYVAELRRSRALVDELSASPGGVARNKIIVLAALTRLRQICCHPALAGGKPSLGSGKFETLIELLEPLLAEGHKVLVFSQFVACLKLLATELRRHGVTQHFLSGATTKREQVVAGFQDDPQPCVFLVSLKAGGTGLNLTAASYVVLFDPWWNPAVEAQAIDRSHRIGQDRTVIAYRLLALGTIEEKIWELQQRKAALARDLLGEEGFARALDRDALTYLLAE